MDIFIINFKDDLKNIKIFLGYNLNNIELIKEMIDNEDIIIGNFDNNNLLYYLCYSLRKGLTDFIQYKNDNIIYSFTKFSRLRILIQNLLTKDKNIYSPSITYENISQDLDIILDYFLDEEEMILTKKNIYEFLDIGSTLSLFLISIHFNKKFLPKMSFDTKSLFDLFQKLYMLCNLLSSTYIDSFSYEKKLILFSLFSVFYVSPIPYNYKLFDKKIFKIYNSINGCILNKNSILFSSNYFNAKDEFKSQYFDIFSKYNTGLFSLDFLMFNSEGNNIIINYHSVCTLFRLMISSLIVAFFDNSYNDLEYTKKFFLNENGLINGHYYSYILYYYNQLNFYLFNNEINSLDNFWSKICIYFSKINNRFPNEKLNEDSKYFFLDDYFKDLMLYNNIKPNILYSFLINYLYEQYKGNFSVNKNDTSLLIFMFKDIWNINFSSDHYKNPSKEIYYLEKLNECLDYINGCNVYIFTSLLILRRILPLILQLFEYYLEKYIKNNQYFDVTKKNIEVFSFEQENIFDSIRKINIIKELENVDYSQDLIVQIITNYFVALKNIIIGFSEFGNDYINNDGINSWSNDNSFININNIKGKGKFESEKERKKREEEERKKREKEEKKKKEEEERKKKEEEERKKKEEEEKKKKEEEERKKKEEEERKKKEKDKISNEKEKDKKNKEKENEDKKNENPIKKDENVINDDNKKENNLKNKNNNEQIGQEGKKKKELNSKNNEKTKPEIKQDIEINAISYFNKVIYGEGIEKLTNNTLILEEIKDTFETEYKNNIDIIQNISNEYFYLFEIIFLCIYLNSLELLNIINEELEKDFNEEGIKELVNINNYIIDFIVTYEELSVYFNFIDEEGHKTYIKTLYDKIYNRLSAKIKLYSKDFKTYDSLRNILIDYRKSNKLFKIFNNGKTIKLPIFKKKVTFLEIKDISKNCGTLDDIDKKFLFNSYHQNYKLFKGPNAEKVSKFFEKIDYDKKDENQKKYILNNYIENYLSIIG